MAQDTQRPHPLVAFCWGTLVDAFEHSGEREIKNGQFCGGWHVEKCLLLG